MTVRNFIIWPGECRVEVTAGHGDEGFMYFLFEALGAEEEPVRKGLNEACSLFAGGREVFWRSRPEARFEKDFETKEEYWRGFARFSVRTAGTIEHEPSDESGEVKHLGLGPSREGA